MVKEDASDLVLKAGGCPAVRVAGVIRFLGDQPLPAELVRSYVAEVLGERGEREFNEHGATDTAVALPGVGCFRCGLRSTHVRYTSGWLAACGRRICGRGHGRRAGPVGADRPPGGCADELLRRRRPLAQLGEERRARALELGGEEAIAKHHGYGRLTVRERAGTPRLDPRRMVMRAGDVLQVLVQPQQFSTASDVWMLGMCFHEVMSNGCRPYSRMPPMQGMAHRPSAVQVSGCCMCHAV